MRETSSYHHGSIAMGGVACRRTWRTRSESAEGALSNTASFQHELSPTRCDSRVVADTLRFRHGSWEYAGGIIARSWRLCDDRSADFARFRHSLGQGLRVWCQWFCVPRAIVFIRIYYSMIAPDRNHNFISSPLKWRSRLNDLNLKKTYIASRFYIRLWSFVYAPS